MIERYRRLEADVRAWCLSSKLSAAIFGLVIGTVMYLGVHFAIVGLIEIWKGLC